MRHHPVAAPPCIAFLDVALASTTLVTNRLQIAPVSGKRPSIHFEGAAAIMQRLCNDYATIRDGNPEPLNQPLFGPRGGAAPAERPAPHQPTPDQAPCHALAHQPIADRLVSAHHHPHLAALAVLGAARHRVQPQAPGFSLARRRGPPRRRGAAGA